MECPNIPQEIINKTPRDCDTNLRYQYSSIEFYPDGTVESSELGVWDNWKIVSDTEIELSRGRFEALNGYNCGTKAVDDEKVLLTVSKEFIKEFRTKIKENEDYKTRH